MTYPFELFNSPLFSDVTITLGKKTIHAHAVILLQSNYFRTLLSSSNSFRVNSTIQEMKEDQHRIPITLKDIDEESALIYLQFLYGARTVDKLASLMGKETLDPRMALKLLLDTSIVRDTAFIRLLWDDYTASPDEELLLSLELKTVAAILELGANNGATELYPAYNSTLLKLANTSPPLLTVDTLNWIISIVLDMEMKIRLAGVWLRNNPVETHELVVMMLPKTISSTNSIYTIVACLSGIDSVFVMRYVIDQLCNKIINPHSDVVNDSNSDESEEGDIPHCNLSSQTKWEYCVCGMALATFAAGSRLLCKWCASDALKRFQLATRKIEANSSRASFTSELTKKSKEKPYSKPLHSPYFYFMQENRARIIEAHPEANSKEIYWALQEAWDKTEVTSDRPYYRAMADKDKVRYDKEVEEEKQRQEAYNQYAQDEYEAHQWIEHEEDMKEDLTGESDSEANNM